MPTRVLVVDDEELVRDLLRLVLSGAGYEVVAAGDGRTALSAGPVDVAIVDLDLGRDCGREVCRRLRERSPSPAVLVVSGGEAAAPDLAELGAAGFLTKPFSPRELLARLRLLESAAFPCGNVCLE